MGLRVLVDDCRDYNVDVIIRNPYIALSVLRRLHKQIEELYMDNDMGTGPEGCSILSDFLDDCRNHQMYSGRVVIVTSNPPAAERMASMLQLHGYKGAPDRRNWAHG